MGISIDDDRWPETSGAMCPFCDGRGWYEVPVMADLCTVADIGDGPMKPLTYTIKRLYCSCRAGVECMRLDAPGLFLKPHAMTEIEAQERAERNAVEDRAQADCAMFGRCIVRVDENGRLSNIDPSAFDFSLPDPAPEKPTDTRLHEAIPLQDWRGKIARQWHRWRLLP